ncbi:hypothetical protein [Clostridium gasigenes]|uniref:hypothetical protein n=1 Tax=Clostridium gasigenes TaxID=94869 RepID=UPI001C0BC4E2|nr:hypothetical protein [Clostridium gasigenes]MBU3103306.1 hypothetical protein [Clostridium gasigenes]
MYNWSEPLPKHTKVDYYECYSKIVLEGLYPNEFDNLEIIDKPDLQSIDGNYGVEVTIAIDKDQLEPESLYTDISYKRIRNVEKASKEIVKCGCKLECGILAGKPGTDSFDLILEAFDNKLNKLNGNKYSFFKQNYLFIFSDIYAVEKMIMNAIKDMRQRQLSKVRQFYKVYVLVPGYCYSLNLDAGSYEIYRIKSSLQALQANKAREFVEK